MIEKVESSCANNNFKKRLKTCTSSLTPLIQKKVKTIFKYTQKKNDKEKTPLKVMPILKKDKSNYALVKDQLEVLLEYIKIIENAPYGDQEEELINISNKMELSLKQCQLYLNRTYLNNMFVSKGINFENYIGNIKLYK